MTEEIVKRYVARSTGRTVVEEARARIAHALDLADFYVVMFSGGKDSTVALNLVAQVAADCGRLPVPVHFVDEEAIPHETVDYVARVAARPEFDLLWSCVPVRHRNACSRAEPYWYPWHPDQEGRWVRPLPEAATTAADRPGVPWGSIAEQALVFYGPDRGTVVQFLGRRSDESLTRKMMVTNRLAGFSSFLGNPGTHAPHFYTADPIYDFTTVDVWSAIHAEGWDYNRAYDLYHAMGMPLGLQRVAPAFGEEPLKNLWAFAVGWPDLWARMQDRVPGADAAVRYARTELYGKPGDHLEPERGESWMEYVTRLMMRWPAEQRAVIAQNVQYLVTQHAHSTGGDPIPEVDPHPKSKVCWRVLAQVAFKGMLKKRTVIQMAR